MGLSGFMLLKIFPVAISGFILFNASVVFALIGNMSENASKLAGGWEAVIEVLATMVALTVAGIFVVFHRWPDMHFHRAVARVQKLTRESHAPVYRVAQCANIAGRAARELFQVVQGRRFTWISPPAVADRALTLSFPLINVELNHAAGPAELLKLIQEYGEFLHFAAGLEAAKRVDLIPALRSYYAEIGH